MSANPFSFSQFSRDARLLTLATGIFAISFLGVQMLSKVLYILRLGYGVEYLGVFGATGAISYMLMSIPSGTLSNYWGARRTMFIGGVITIIAMGMLPAVEYLPAGLHLAWPIITQAVLSAGWALFNINLVPTLMGATTPQNRSSAYALNSVFRGMGSFIGILTGGMLPGLFVYTMGYRLDLPDPYRLSLWVSAALGLIALIPLFLVRPVKQVNTVMQDRPREGFPWMIIILLVFHVYFAQIGIAVCQTFCSAYMDTDLRLSPAMIGLITGAGQFAAIWAPLFAPRLGERYGHAWVLMATTVGTAVSLLPLALIPHWASVGIGGIGIIALAAMWMPALQVFQMELVDARWRSLAYGIVSMAMSLTYASTSFFGGHFVERWGYPSLFLLSMGLSLVGVVIVWGMRRASATLVQQRA